MEHLLLNPTAGSFDGEINRLLADGKDAELFDRLAELPTVVSDLRSNEDDRFDVPIPIGNACALAALALRRGKRGVAETALDALLAAYRLGTVAADGGPDDDIRLWESAAAGLWALGAVAAELADWPMVRSIVARQPDEGGYYATWLRHGQVMSARGSTDPADDNVLNLCLQTLTTNPSFGMTASSATSREQAVCTFDQLAWYVVASLDIDGGDFYPSYAKYPVAHVEPAVIAMRKPGALRDAIFPGSNEDLRGVLREKNELAELEAAKRRYRNGSWAYEGFQDARTLAFIVDGSLIEDWGNLLF